MKLRAIIKRADEAGGHVSYISDTLTNLQTQVGGHIECVTFRNGAAPFVVICAEEGALKDIPFNCTIDDGERRVQFFGDIILLGVNGEEFADLPAEITLPVFRSMVRSSRIND